MPPLDPGAARREGTIEHRRAAPVDPRDDRELLAAWLRHGEWAHAQIPVLGLRWKAPPDQPARRQAHPEARHQPIDDVFVPLYVQSAGDDGHDRGRPGDLHGGQRTRVTLDQALGFASRRGPVRMVLLGDPGSGKTTLLRHLFRCLARDGAPRLDAPTPLVGLHPVWVSLSTITDGELAADDLAPVVRRVAAAERHAAGAEVVLRGGSPALLVLLDGLDEIRDASMRTQTLALLDRAVSRWPASAFVLTSRLTQWQQLQVTPQWQQLASRFLEVSVAALDAKTRSDYVRAWFRAHERRRNPLRDEAAIEPEAQEQAALLLERLAAPAWAHEFRLAQMIANPLMLSTLCALHAAGGQPPERPAELYDAVLRLLIENWQRPGRPALPREEARLVLEPLAYRSQEGNGRAMRHDLAVAIVEPPLAKTRALRIQTPTATEFLAVMRDDCGILAGDDPGYVEFLHLQFREYLAAGHIGRQGMGQALAARLGESDEAHWKETMLLAMQLPGVSGPFLDAALAGGALATSPDLVRACVVEAGAQLDAGPIEGAVDRALARPGGVADEEVKADLEALFALVRGLELPGMSERRRAFEQALSRTALRVGWDWTPGTPMVLPVTGMAFQWIGPGRFTMGSTDEDLLASEDEKPAHAVTITKGYWMGEHPVTNAQYRAFVAATGHRAPGSWGERRFNDPAQPVVRVSWGDAQAFCAWFNAQVPSDVTVRFRLPTEAEWEYAARGTGGRRYPWGNEPPDATLATFSLDWTTGGPSAVGQHPAGVSPFGLHDLAGNVYEWCEDEYRRYRPESRTDSVVAGRGSNGVLRGGSWCSDARYVRAAYRDDYPRGNAGDNLGFRLAGGLSAPRQPKRK